MNITLEMKIQDQEFDLVVDMTMKAGRIYRQQYNRDLAEDLAEMSNLFSPNPFKYIDPSSIDMNTMSEEEIYDRVMRKAIPEYLLNKKAGMSLSFDQTERAYQIIWAFAKNADEKLPTCQVWEDIFDFVLPVSTIIPALYEAWEKTARPIVEIKN